MKRREWFGSMSAVGCLALVKSPAFSFAIEPVPAAEHRWLNSAAQSLQTALVNCQQDCEAVLTEYRRRRSAAADANPTVAAQCRESRDLCRMLLSQLQNHSGQVTAKSQACAHSCLRTAELLQSESLSDNRDRCLQSCLNCSQGILHWLFAAGQLEPQIA